MAISRDQAYVEVERQLHVERVEHAQTRRELAAARRSARLNRALLGEVLAMCRGCDTCNPPVEEADPAS